jgi:hypothetical protein
LPNIKLFVFDLGPSDVSIHCLGNLVKLSSVTDLTLVRSHNEWNFANSRATSNIFHLLAAPKALASLSFFTDANDGAPFPGRMQQFKRLEHLALQADAIVRVRRNASPAHTTLKDTLPTSLKSLNMYRGCSTFPHEAAPLSHTRLLHFPTRGCCHAVAGRYSKLRLSAVETHCRQGLRAPLLHLNSLERPG